MQLLNIFRVSHFELVVSWSFLFSVFYKMSHPDVDCSRTSFCLWDKIVLFFWFLELAFVSDLGVLYPAASADDTCCSSTGRWTCISCGSSWSPAVHWLHCWIWSDSSGGRLHVPSSSDCLHACQVYVVGFGFWLNRIVWTSKVWG